MAIAVTSRDSAWEAARLIFPTEFTRDYQSSVNAGYPIYRSNDSGNPSWLSDLGNRLELNIYNASTKATKSINIWVEEVKEQKDLSKDQLIAYLQSQMDNFKKEERRYGIGDRIVVSKLDAMIACKEMVEALIGEPINLRHDGKVTVGF